MGNVFINVPVPAANGSGAAVDVSGMGASKTISVTGPFVASVTIEVSNEAAPTQWAPLITFGNPDGIVRDVAARWMRATVADYKSGTPQCDVGGDDSGATFANLPVTAGNGNGAAVDVSDLPLFKTATVGGPFRGNVQIEISDDGISNWSQIGFGFGNPGLQSQKFTASYMRVVRQGVPTIAPGLPIVDIAACESGGGGGGGGDATITQFTYRPGSGLTGPYVWDDFNALYAAFDAARTVAQQSGKFLIIFDSSIESPCVVNSGSGAVTYDFEYATLIGAVEEANVDLEWTDGGGEGNTLDVINASWWEGLNVTNLGQGALISASDGECITLTRTRWTGIDLPILDIRGGISVTINLENESQLTTADESNPPITLVDSALTIHANGAACLIAANAVAASGGGPSLTIDTNSSSAIIDFNQPALTANTNTACSYWFDSTPNTNPNGLIAGALGGGTLLVNPTTGVIWRCTGGTGWVVDGSGGPQRFKYTVTGAEPDKANIVVALPAVRADALYNVQCTMGTFTALLVSAVPVASRAVNQFVLSLSALATAGDTFDFIVSDPT